MESHQRSSGRKGLHFNSLDLQLAKLKALTDYKLHEQAGAIPCANFAPLPSPNPTPLYTIEASGDQAFTARTNMRRNINKTAFRRTSFSSARRLAQARLAQWQTWLQNLGCKTPLLRSHYGRRRKAAKRIFKRFLRSKKLLASAGGVYHSARFVLAAVAAARKFLLASLAKTLYSYM